MKTGVVRNNIVATDPGHQDKSDTQTQKEKELLDVKNRISEIESMPTESKKQKLKRDHLWFKAKLDMDMDENIDLKEEMSEKDLKSIQEEINEGSEEFNIEFDPKYQTKQISVADELLKQKKKVDKKMKEEEKNDHGRKMVWYKSGKIQEVKVADPKPSRSKYWYKKPSPPTPSSPSKPATPKDKNLNWFGKIKSKFMKTSEVKPETPLRGSIELTNSTNNGFESERRLGRSTFKDIELPSNDQVLTTQQNFYKSPKEDLRHSFGGTKFGTLDRRGNNFENSVSFDETLQSRETIFRKIGNRLRDEDDDDEGMEKSPTDRKI